MTSLPAIVNGNVLNSRHNRHNLKHSLSVKFSALTLFTSQPVAAEEANHSWKLRKREPLTFGARIGVIFAAVLVGVVLLAISIIWLFARRRNRRLRKEAERRRELDVEADTEAAIVRSQNELNANGLGQIEGGTGLGEADKSTANGQVQLNLDVTKHSSSLPDEPPPDYDRRWNSAAVATNYVRST